MKMIFKSLVVIAFFFCFSVGQVFTASAEVKDLGEVCFDMLPSMVFEGIGGQLKVGVLSFASGHFILDGKIVPRIIFEPHGHVHGSAFVDGNKIIMSLTSSNVVSIVDNRSGDNSFFQIELDAQTLSGLYMVMSYHFESGKSVTNTLDYGIISIGQCQQ